MSSSSPSKVAVIGGGPAGLMAAEVLSSAGASVTVYDRMPSLGRKFLMAGRGGLNLTHSEPLDRFLRRYGPATERLRGMIEAFPPKALIKWAEGLGQQTFVGSSGRVFPKAMKASPLLREWLKQLEAQGVAFRPRRTWTGWTDAGELKFAGPEGDEVVRADAVIMALGGGSWAKLGSDGRWTTAFEGAGARITPFRPSNVGFLVPWSEVFKERFAGTPLKAVGLTFAGRQVKGEIMLSAYGLEGGGIYALSSALRDAVEGQGEAVLEIDLRPDLSAGQIENKLARGRKGESVANLLRKALNLSPAAIGLLREACGVNLPATPTALAALVKAAPVKLTGCAPMDRAISTAGGVSLDSVNADLMLKARPGVFLAGEMLDWEAPTGGYLLQASFATGRAAALGVLAYLRN
ncbi:TIGR03862 family flavoprotein [Caulobacter segnis]|uniref:TIGR03862 family flavoprotein n=1 Tax=Caulobacter segnis TaxID=88688 RepID=UPI00240EFC17|nr:TIGR03862 family flavoprotein [Caulobacter segnis]MDG2523115.1 TIGR03862 family flavoprotein [Caulobacter segnis]